MQRQKRRWWTRGITWLSLVAIAGALISGLFQLAVAVAPGYRDELAQRASEAIGQPVQVDQLALRWRWLWPLLELDGLRLMDATGATPVIAARRARLGFALPALLRGEWVPSEVEVDGLSLALQRTAEGRFRLKGGATGRQPPTFREVAEGLKRFSRLRATNVALSVEDLATPPAGFALTLQRGDLRLSDQGFELRAELAAAQLVAQRIRLRAGITGDLAEPEEWRGRWSLDASGLVAGAPLITRWPALAALQLNEAKVTAAGDWQAGALGASELSFAAQSAQLDGHATSVLREIDLGLHYRPAPQGGTVDLVPLRLTGKKGSWPVATARIDWRRESPNAPMAFSGNSEFLRLDDLAPWLAAFSNDATADRRELLASLKGDLSGLEARWQGPGVTARYRLHGRFTDLAGSWPGQLSAEGVDGELTADEQGGRLLVKDGPIGIDLPRTFENPIRFDKLGGEARWERLGEADADASDDTPPTAIWQLTLPHFEWSLLGSEGRGNAELKLVPGQRPVMKLEAGFSAKDAATLKPFMPRFWGQGLKDWLERAVVRGRVGNATLLIDGPLADFPFHQRQTGRWSLKLPVSGARLEYQPDWPGVDQLAATLEFAGNGLSFAAQRGIISGIAVTSASGQIADFAQAPLMIDGRTTGETSAYYAFLRASPLATKLAGLLRHSEAAGPAETDVHLEVPLHHVEGEHVIARGEVRLAGNTLHHTALDAPVTDIAGSLRFATGVIAEKLEGRFHGTPVVASIAPNAEGVDELGARFTVVQGDGSELPRHYLPIWLRSRLEGSSAWQLALPLSGAKSGHARLTSDLVGTAVRLPPPLAKPATEKMPLVLDIHGDDTVPLAITGDIGGQLGLALRFARGNPGLAVRAVSLRFGGAAPALPTDDGLRLAGQLGTVDPRDWRSLLQDLQPAKSATASGTATETLPFVEAKLGVGRLRVPGFEIPEVRIEARREYGGYVAELRGPGTEGRARMSTKGDALTGRFSALRLLPLPKQPTAVAAAEADEVPLDPRDAPTLDLAVEALEIGGRSFGALSLASDRSGNGQTLRQFTLKGGIASLDASGEWRRAGGLTEARSKFLLASDDLAGTLEALGFAPNISGRDAKIEGELTWPAAARGFDWAQGRGTVALQVESGALRTVDPGGGGRVLGLFNFYALPRRLTLDFGDVVSQGLGFDRIEGTFALANGVAHTDNLTVRGPSVKIDVHGDVGLAAQNYNQIITVTPNTSGLTFGALLLGGASALAAPVLPIIAVIANQVIDKPLAQVTQISYGLTGSWEDPAIRKIEPAAEPPKPEPAKP